MKNLADELKLAVEDAVKNFGVISEAEWKVKPLPEKWSKMEVLGHLIDSASNNHHRFIRLQYETLPCIVYDQNSWVELQHYNELPVENVISLWKFSNLHLCGIIKHIPKEKYSCLCDIKKEQPVTLEWIVKDYLRHLKHHLAQII